MLQNAAELQNYSAAAQICSDNYGHLGKVETQENWDLIKHWSSKICDYQFEVQREIRPKSRHFKLTRAVQSKHVDRTQQPLGETLRGCHL